MLPPFGHYSGFVKCAARREACECADTIDLAPLSLPVDPPPPVFIWVTTVGPAEETCKTRPLLSPASPRQRSLHPNECVGRDFLTTFQPRSKNALAIPASAPYNKHARVVRPHVSWPAAPLGLQTGRGRNFIAVLLVDRATVSVYDDLWVG